MEESHPEPPCRRSRGRERLSRAAASPGPSPALESIADLIGSVGGLPVDLSGRKKFHLRKTGYGRKRPR